MKILFVRFSSIGDIVLTTPVICAVAEQLPDAEIHYLTKKSFLPLLEYHPDIEKIYTIKSSTKEVIEELKAEKYDFVIDLHKNIRTLKLKLSLGVKSYSFNKLNIEKWLFVQFKLNKLPKKHIVERYFDAVKPIGVTNQQQLCNIYFSPNQLVKTVNTFGLEPKTYLAVAVGAQFATKTMPAEKLAAILLQTKVPIVLLGGPDDQQRGAKIMELLEDHPFPVINTIARFSIMQSASIVSQAKALLTHDTGLMHIATAFTVPIISIWGNTTPDFGMYPYYPNQPELFKIHEVPNLDCRPCSKIGFQSCPKKHFKCMLSQDEKKIVQSIEQQFENTH